MSCSYMKTMNAWPVDMSGSARKSSSSLMIASFCVARACRDEVSREGGVERLERGEVAWEAA